MPIARTPGEDLAVGAVPIAHEITGPLLPAISLRQLLTYPFRTGMRIVRGQLADGSTEKVLSCRLAKSRVNHPPHGITLCGELVAVAVAQIDRDPVVRDRLV